MRIFYKTLVYIFKSYASFLKLTFEKLDNNLMYKINKKSAELEMYDYIYDTLTDTGKESSDAERCFTYKSRNNVNVTLCKDDVNYARYKLKNKYTLSKLESFIKSEKNKLGDLHNYRKYICDTKRGIEITSSFSTTEEISDYLTQLSKKTDRVSVLANIKN